MKTTFPTLYKRTSTGAIERWDIEVRGTTITTRFGQVDGKIQETSDVIKTGKNSGKKNATTAEEQAVAEAKAKWTKQIERKGYVEEMARARVGATDAAGGYAPMLAHKFKDHADKVRYPAYVQPKLDGIRCIAVIEKGRCTLWSRTRKQITSCPHIVEAVEALKMQNAILDGELYTHKLRKDFEEIISAVRKEDPSEKSKQIEYHVYDTIHATAFRTRADLLVDILGHETKLPLVRVATFVAQTEDDIVSYFEDFRAQGYEGLIVRQADGKYESKRTTALLKVKEFSDDDYPVIGVEEGRGKLQGHVGAFICKLPNGAEFRVKMSGELTKLKAYFENRKLWQGKKLVVSYQNLTKDGVPRCPVGKRFKDPIEG